MRADAVLQLGAAEVEAVGVVRAANALEEILRSGFQPSDDLPRTVFDIDHGQFLIMPSYVKAAAGVKIVTVVPSNTDVGLPRVQACYLMYDESTLTLSTIIDGTALTLLRTPAVSLCAIRPWLSGRSDLLDLMVFGAGPQASAHVAALRASGSRLGDVTYVVREPDRANVPLGAMLLKAGTASVNDRLRRADVVICATTARSPLFESNLLRDETLVVAVGSHEPEARELDSALTARAQVVVEDPGTALREAGDVVIAVAEGALRPDDLVGMESVVTGKTVLYRDRPVVFKSTGMSWQDLVVARVVVSAHRHPDSSVAPVGSAPGPG